MEAAAAMEAVQPMVERALEDTAEDQLARTAALVLVVLMVEPMEALRPMLQITLHPVDMLETDINSNTPTFTQLTQ